jgi:hypothetical protein
MRPRLFHQTDAPYQRIKGHPAREGGMTDLFSYEPPAKYPTTPGFKTDGTSKEAAEKIAGTSEAARGQILSLLWKSKAMSADEIGAHFGWTPLYVRPRVSELHKLGAIKKAGRRRNASGLNAWTWTIA